MQSEDTPLHTLCIYQKLALTHFGKYFEYFDACSAAGVAREVGIYKRKQERNKKKNDNGQEKKENKLSTKKVTSIYRYILYLDESTSERNYFKWLKVK